MIHVKLLLYFLEHDFAIRACPFIFEIVIDNRAEGLENM